MLPDASGAVGYWVLTSEASLLNLLKGSAVARLTMTIDGLARAMRSGRPAEAGAGSQSAKMNQTDATRARVERHARPRSPTILPPGRLERDSGAAARRKIRAPREIPRSTH